LHPVEQAKADRNGAGVWRNVFTGMTAESMKDSLTRAIQCQALYENKSNLKCGPCMGYMCIFQFWCKGTPEIRSDDRWTDRLSVSLPLHNTLQLKNVCEDEVITRKRQTETGSIR